MIILPAIDIKDGQCVRLVRGDYATAHKVAEDPIETALSFQAAGAKWLHMVDLDGAKDKKLSNREVFLSVAKATNLKIEVGGGIRTLESIEFYLERGISRVILGSAALKNPDLVKTAVREFGGAAIAVGIDAKDEQVATEGWLDASDVHYLDLARKMEQFGVKCIIFTDISKDGTLQGPNLSQLGEINDAVSCDIIASGGISCIEDIKNLRDLHLYGAICGKSLYSGNLALYQAIEEGKNS